MEFSGRQLERLAHAIVDLYTPDRFNRLLRSELGRELPQISLAVSFSDIVFDVIMSAERQSWLSDLVTALIRDNPGNRELGSLATSPPVKSVDFAVVVGDVFTSQADVLALKYAQSFYGVDLRVAEALTQVGVNRNLLEPRVGDYKLVESRRALRIPQVLFVGVPELVNFTYKEIREFSSSVIKILAPDDSVSHLAMTLHGANYGLDEIEALFSIMAGSVEALTDTEPLYLHRISVLERNPNRARRLGRALRHGLEQSGYSDFDIIEGEAEWIVRLRFSSITEPFATTRIGESQERRPRISRASSLLCLSRRSSRTSLSMVSNNPLAICNSYVSVQTTKSSLETL
jgi:Effector-associated domain 1